MRGMADDLPLLDWLKRRIWPLEAAHDEASLRASAELGLLEAMTGGTTTVLDMGTVRGHDAVMDACVRSGVRAISGKAMMDRGEGVPAGLRESTRDSLRESERLARDWSRGRRGPHRLRMGAAVHPVVQRGAGPRRGGARRASATRSSTPTPPSTRPSARPSAPRSATTTWPSCAAGAWPGPAPCSPTACSSSRRGRARWPATGTRVVHCPSANLKLGSGIARVAELDGLGVQLALGADGAPCNNNLDAWTELRHAALLAKIRTGVTTLPAARALRLATIDGARALGLDALVGSIEPGKRADLAVVRLDGAARRARRRRLLAPRLRLRRARRHARAGRRTLRGQRPRAPHARRRGGEGPRARAGPQARWRARACSAARGIERASASSICDRATASASFARSSDCRSDSHLAWAFSARDDSVDSFCFVSPSSWRRARALGLERRDAVAGGRELAGQLVARARGLGQLALELRESSPRRRRRPWPWPRFRSDSSPRVADRSMSALAARSLASPSSRAALASSAAMRESRSFSSDADLVGVLGAQGRDGVLGLLLEGGAGGGEGLLAEPGAAVVASSPSLRAAAVASSPCLRAAAVASSPSLRAAASAASWVAWASRADWLASLRSRSSSCW